MFHQDRTQSRQYFITVWQKHLQGQAVEPLEKIIIDVLVEHPEYHALLNENILDKDYLPEMGETNPFLHLGLHIALQEQLMTDRPPGIVKLYQQLNTKANNRHELEHRMMNCLAESLWQAQRYGTMPDEKAYLNCLRHLRKHK